VTNLSVYAATKGAVYAATKGAVETLVGQLPSSSASTAPGACNGVMPRRPAIAAFCKQPEDVQEAARLRRSPAMRFATNYETRSRGVDSGSYSEERHFGARLVSSVAKTTRPQDGALYSFGATFPGYCCERNSIPAR
jgi:hypothetical protein